MKMEVNGKTVDFLPPVKRYVNSIERRLQLPFKVRAKVMMDVSTGMAMRHEAGESYEAIMADMGTPREVAKGINREMADYTYRKSPWRWVFLVLALLAAAFIVYNAGMGTAANAIGGADGPTAIIVTGGGFFTNYKFVHELCLWVVPLGVAGFVWLSHLKPNKKHDADD